MESSTILVHVIFIFLKQTWNGKTTRKEQIHYLNKLKYFKQYLKTLPTGYDNSITVKGRKNSVHFENYQFPQDWKTLEVVLSPCGLLGLKYN